MLKRYHWMGRLVIPHLSRMLVGHDHKKLIPAAIVVSASFLMVADLFARALQQQRFH